MKKILDESDLLYVTDRQAWRNWLKAHYNSQGEVWIVYYKKHTKKPRIPYNDAVEEALCFGWIDSTVRSIDNDSYAQRFSVRNPKTPYSQANKERLRELIKQGKVIDTIMATLGDIDNESFEVPKDILQAIKANKKAWKNYQTLSQPYIRIRIGFIGAARKRPQEFEKRLKHFIEMTEKNKLFGYGGIEEYY
ncbi:MAG: YdeI/OmpD-associated family protein [Chloroflexota bacterium]|nr:YdeI/OmpD-associated family protein [Chloroflexota bacterium]